MERNGVWITLAVGIVALFSLLSTHLTMKSAAKQKALDTLQAQVDRLERSLERAENQIRVLSDEKMQLMRQLIKMRDTPKEK